MIKSFYEYVELLAKCIHYLSVSNGFKFMLAVVFGLLFGAACYWFASFFSRLWHRSYNLRAPHHVLCAIAAVITLLFALVYVSVDFMEQVSKQTIQDWQSQLSQDRDWGRDMFIRAYEAVSKAGQEDMTGVGNPRIESGVVVPMNKWETKMLVAQTYAGGALENFQQQHPYLQFALQPSTQAPEEGIKQDVLDFFKNDPNERSYPAIRAAHLAASYLETQAQSQLPGIESYTHRVTWALFILVQLVVLTVISSAAYRALTATV